MQIRPFRGWRYNPRAGDVSALIAPPYDILSAADKEALLARDATNIVAVDMPHVPPKELGPEHEYQAAADLLKQWQSSGVLAQEAAPAIYAYEQTYTWAGRTYSRRALLCGVRATKLGDDVIPHEHTFAGPKADRLKLMQLTSVGLSPIFGFYEGPKVADALWSAARGAPTLHGELAGVSEKLWVVTDAHVIVAVAHELARVPVFIADGHHRYTTALNYRDALAAQTGSLPPEHEANYVMFALVERSDPGLLILPTHRIIHGLAPDFTVERMVASAREFQWHSVKLPAGGIADADAFLRPFGRMAMAVIGWGDHAMVGVLKDLSAMGAAAPDELPVWRSLDVAILHKLIIDKALVPWRSDKMSVDYTPQSPAVLAACKARQADMGVLLAGTPLDAVEAVARAGASMPHKSTYFYPKLATGMVLKPLGEQQ